MGAEDTIATVVDGTPEDQEELDSTLQLGLNIEEASAVLVNFLTKNFNKSKRAVYDPLNASAIRKGKAEYARILKRMVVTRLNALGKDMAKNLEWYPREDYILVSLKNNDEFKKARRAGVLSAAKARAEAQDAAQKAAQTRVEADAAQAEAEKGATTSAANN